MELFGKRFFTLGHHILAGLLLCLLDVHGTAGSLNILRHLPGDFFILADEVCRVAELMPLRVPQKIQEEEVVLSAKQPGTTSHHLAVEAAHFGRAQHYDAVYGRAVPPLRQQHGIAEHIVFARVEVAEDLSPVLTGPVDLCGAEPVPEQDVTKFLACLDQREKHHRLAV